MTMQEAQSAFDALQMGVIYADEIGDDKALAELKTELMGLVNKNPQFSDKASAILNLFFQ